MNRVRAALLLIVAAACSSQPAPVPQNAPQNVANAASPRVTIAPDQALGWIGIAPRPARDAGDWIPAGAQAVIVPTPADGLVAGATLSAIDVTGRVRRVTAGAPAKVPYGCDDHQLDVLGFTGEPAAPGPVWLLPPGAPASWRPGALPITSPVAATEARRRDTVGPLSLVLERTDRPDPTHGTLTIVRDGRTLHTAAISRGEMEGAAAAPLDLRHPGIAIPTPVAAWSFADGGPILLVLLVPSYEGLHLKPILVEHDGARELPAMTSYLYTCAF